MAPNSFATMLNRKTNRVTLILVYAVLEWTLIFFLLLNSLFSYLIIKFANYFGLKSPCLLCSRIDHIFKSQNSNFSYRDLICEHHAIELSRSGYCFNHRKLVESQDMCEDCWSYSEQGNHQHPTVVLAFRWLKEIGMVKSDGDCKVVESYDVNLRCSCCGVDIKSEILSPQVFIKPSLEAFDDTQKADIDELPHDRDFNGVLDDTQKEDRNELPHDVDGESHQNGADLFCMESKGDNGVESSRDIQLGPDTDLLKEDDNLEGYSFSLSKEGYSLVEADEGDEDVVLEAETEPLLKGSDASIGYPYIDEKILPQHLEFYIDLDDYQLIPIELADSETEKSKGENQDDEEEDWNNKEKVNELWRETDEDLVLEPGMTVAPVPLDALEKLNSSSLIWLELGKTQIEDFPSEEAQEQVVIVKELCSEKDEKEDEIKREVDVAVVLDEGEVEILPNMEGQPEVVTEDTNFDVAGEQECDAASVDQITGEEVTELIANIPLSGMNVASAALEALEKLNPPSVTWSELEETQIEHCPSKQAQEQVVIREIDDEVELDETKVKDLCSGRDQKEDEINVDAAVVLDEGKFEILPIIEVQLKVATEDINFHVAGDQECDAACVDQVTEEREVTELIANIPPSDFEDVWHQEKDEIDIVSSVEPINTSQVAGTLRHCKDERPSTNHIICEASASCYGLFENGDHEFKQIEETRSHEDMAIEITELELQNDSLHHLHKEIPFLRRMGSADVKTLDDSIVNDEVATVEKLKNLLESERKALHALHAELEEERNAAAIATNHTMAMINRLQEEKATIEMEALQYQRLMEEQSEYDQEALQLMNEMLVNREKDLQELEKELEAYRKKVMDYEERERIRLLTQRKDRSCINSGEESDGISVDLYNVSQEEEDGSCKFEENGKHHNTPVDSILDLQDSLSRFEEERLSILEQLKVLEEKLYTLSEEEEHHIENMKPFEQFYEENAKEFDEDIKLNGDTNEKHHQERSINGSKPKQLLPLFDAAEIESDSDLSNEVEDGYAPLAMHKPLPTKFELEKKRLAIEEEVDHVYERLHALEADREFVKHCVGSLRKGDKGVHLLQEILEHLRDLKNIELQAKNV